MMRNKRGMTLVELIVYFALTVLAGVLLWGFQNIAKSSHRTASASYLVGGETETCTQWIRRDINETALASIQVYPSAVSPDEAPGMSMVSSRAFDPDLKGEVLVNSWGAPQWDKHVLYTIDREAGERTGNLVRWEKEIADKNMLPVLAGILPGAAAKENHRVLLRDVMAPDTTVDGVGPQGSVSTDQHGGFRAQFIRRANGSGGEESVTSVNPTQGDPRNNTRMMDLELKILQDSHSQANYYEVRFRVAARH
jgi:type II secretory pathway pseudopilin PulG